jgi:hypothetical protein
MIEPPSRKAKAEKDSRSLLDGYTRKAEDSEAEAEATEWCECLCGDSIADADESRHALNQSD